MTRGKPRRPRVFVAGLVTVMGLLAGLLALYRDNGRHADSVARPSTRCDIDPADGEVAISAAIAACPDGSTVRFPPNRRYTQAAKIEVRDRRNVTIDGNGSTFTSTADGSTTQAVNPVWLILRGHRITMKNMAAVGSFDVPGPRDLSKLQPPRFTEAIPGFGLYGVDTVTLVDVKALRVWGDGVTTAPAHYADPGHVGANDFTKNVLIDRMTVETVGRMCWGPTSGDNIVIRNSSCADAWYGGIDAETDNFTQPVRGHKYLGNTFRGYGNFGILVPVAGDATFSRDIEIRDNRFLTGPDKVCSATIWVGAYPDSNPRLFENVTVEGNEIRSVAVAVWLDHVKGGSVKDNVVIPEPAPQGFTAQGWCGFDDAIRVTNATGVVVDGNR